jgi:hypothetical protein
MAIKHEIKTLMARDEIARAEADAKAEAARGRYPRERELLVSRQHEEQASSFATKAAARVASIDNPHQRIMQWLLPRVGGS